MPKWQFAKYYKDEYDAIKPSTLTSDKLTFSDTINIKDNTVSYIRILSSLAFGNDVFINNEVIDDKNRKFVFNILLNIYSRTIESQKRKATARN